MPGVRADRCRERCRRPTVDAAADRGLRAARRHPHRGAGLQRRRDRLALRAPVRRRARVRRGWSAGRPRERSGSGPSACRGRRSPLPAGTPRRWRRPGRWADGRLTLTEAMVAEVAGQPAARDAAGAPAVRRGRPRRGRHRVRPSPRRAPPPPRVGRRGPDLVCEWGSLALSLGCDPELDIEPGRPTRSRCTPGRPVTLVLAVAHREPLVHVDPAAAWDLSPRTRPAGGPGPREIDQRSPTATPSCAAC